MFKYRIVVRAETDVGMETSALVRTARRQLDEPTTAAMCENVRVVIANMKASVSELAGTGVSADITKIVRSDNYEITIEAQQSAKPRTTKPIVFTRLFGR